MVLCNLRADVLRHFEVLAPMAALFLAFGRCESLENQVEVLVKIVDFSGALPCPFVLRAIQCAMYDCFTVKCMIS